MNRRTLAGTAIALAMTAAANAAATTDLPATADLAAAAAPAATAPAALQPDRVQPTRSVVAPPKPKPETIVQPGLDKIEKHERLTDVLRARMRAGGTGRVEAD